MSSGAVRKMQREIILLTWNEGGAISSLGSEATIAWHFQEDDSLNFHFTCGLNYYKLTSISPTYELHNAPMFRPAHQLNTVVKT